MLNMLVSGDLLFSSVNHERSQCILLVGTNVKFPSPAMYVVFRRLYSPVRPEMEKWFG